MTTKVCNKCGKEKELSCFSKHDGCRLGVANVCKDCVNIRNINRYRTKEGFAFHMYNRQVCHSKKRGHAAPAYTKNDFVEWLFSQSLFHKLFKQWEDSGYEKDLAPSVDRDDDNIGYSFDNIKLTCWLKNREKSYLYRKIGLNNKMNKTVLQYDKDGSFIAEYYSTMEAYRQTGAFASCISAVCLGKRNSAKGFYWKYKSK